MSMVEIGNVTIQNIAKLIQLFTLVITAGNSFKELIGRECIRIPIALVNVLVNPNANPNQNAKFVVNLAKNKVGVSVPVNAKSNGIKPRMSLLISVMIAVSFLMKFNGFVFGSDVPTKSGKGIKYANTVVKRPSKTDAPSMSTTLSLTEFPKIILIPTS